MKPKKFDSLKSSLYSVYTIVIVTMQSVFVTSQFVAFIRFGNFKNIQEIVEFIAIGVGMFIACCEILTILIYKNEIIEVEEILERKFFVTDDFDEKIIREKYKLTTK